MKRPLLNFKQSNSLWFMSKKNKQNNYHKNKTTYMVYIRILCNNKWPIIDSNWGYEMLPNKHGW